MSERRPIPGAELARLVGLPASVGQALQPDLDALEASLQDMLALALPDAELAPAHMPLREDLPRPWPRGDLLDARNTLGPLVQVPGVPGLTQATVQKMTIQRGDDGPTGLPQWPPTREDA